MQSFLSKSLKKYTEKFIEQERLALEEWMYKEDSLFFEDFAFSRGYSRQRLSEFEKKSEVFSDTITRARTGVIARLKKGGIFPQKTGMNPGFVRFCLSMNYDESKMQQADSQQDKKKPSPNAWRHPLEDMEPVDLDELEREAGEGGL